MFLCQHCFWQCNFWNLSAVSRRCGPRSHIFPKRKTEESCVHGQWNDWKQTIGILSSFKNWERHSPKLFITFFLKQTEVYWISSFLMIFHLYIFAARLAGKTILLIFQNVFSVMQISTDDLFLDCDTIHCSQHFLFCDYFVAISSHFEMFLCCRHVRYGLGCLLEHQQALIFRWNWIDQFVICSQNPCYNLSCIQQRE